MEEKDKEDWKLKIGSPEVEKKRTREWDPQAGRSQNPIPESPTPRKQDASMTQTPRKHSESMDYS